MSQDFVRRLPGAGMTFGRRSGWGTRLHIDVTLILLLLVTCAYGLIVLYSALGRETAPLISQVTKMGLATVGMLVMAQLPPLFYMRIAPFAYGIGVILLIAVLVAGTVVNGSQRWLRIPGIFNFQPSEVMKLVLPMMLAWYFNDRHLPPRPKHLFWAMVMIVVPVLLIARQPDLGTSLLIGASGMLVLLLAGISWRWVFGVLGLGLACLPALWYVMHDYQRERVLTLFDPERDPLGSGWNIIQSKTA
ncbi:MAG: FtsW/RodA/SpoVE family cell cycle protein, partial [Pseudomonadales bacterium]|nr:FtsW/RodA/SpoVE family cell cycle protein [Pseudomonadales bacterium]